MAIAVVLWALGAVAVLVGEAWALYSRADGDTITETFKSHWLSHGIMMGLVTWAVWHFGTPYGGAVDFIPLTIGVVAGIVSNRWQKTRT